MSHADLIDSLGGAAAVANQFGLAQTVVANWRVRGVAWQWRPAIAEFAKAEGKGSKIPDGFLVPSKQKDSQPNGGPAPDSDGQSPEAV